MFNQSDFFWGLHNNKKTVTNQNNGKQKVTQKTYEWINPKLKCSEITKHVVIVHVERTIIIQAIIYSNSWLKIWNSRIIESSHKQTSIKKITRYLLQRNAHHFYIKRTLYTYSSWNTQNNHNIITLRLPLPLIEKKIQLMLEICRMSHEIQSLGCIH